MNKITRKRPQYDNMFWQSYIEKCSRKNKHLGLKLVKKYGFKCLTEKRYKLKLKIFMKKV